VTLTSSSSSGGPLSTPNMSVKEHLESRFGRNVDLVLRDAIKPALRSAILARSVNVPGI